MLCCSIWGRLPFGCNNQTHKARCRAASFFSRQKCCIDNICIYNLVVQMTDFMRDYIMSIAGVMETRAYTFWPRCLVPVCDNCERTFECALNIFFSMACKVLGPSTGGCWRSRTNCHNSSCFGRIVPRRTVVGSSNHDQPATSQRSMDTLDLLLGSTDPSPGVTHKSSDRHIFGLYRCLQAIPFVPRTNTQSCSQRTLSMRSLQLLLRTLSVANPRHKQKQNKAP